jgi:hypothetical protein
MLALITDMYFVARPVQALNSNSVVNFRALHQPTAAILGHSNAHHHHHDKNHSSKEPANDEGAFCCHYSTVATDACNTCQAPSTTGHCAIAADNCTACGGAWCLPATPSPTPMNYVAPLPGICCHYATDITDVCGTCKAPDNGGCGKDAGKMQELVQNSSVSVGACFDHVAFACLLFIFSSWFAFRIVRGLRWRLGLWLVPSSHCAQVCAECIDCACSVSADHCCCCCYYGSKSVLQAC